MPGVKAGGALECSVQHLELRIQVLFAQLVVLVVREGGLCAGCPQRQQRCLQVAVPACRVLAELIGMSRKVETDRFFL
jgi:hypothetical protein